MWIGHRKELFINLELLYDQQKTRLFNCEVSLKTRVQALAILDRKRATTGDEIVLTG